MTEMAVSAFNVAEANVAAERLLSICHSRDWLQAMLARRPFISLAKLTDTAIALWQQVDEAAALDAFSGHAKIGDIDAIRSRFATASEQGQVLQSPESVIRDLADYNQRYEQRFGFIFIVCASGLSAEQMLAKLQARIDNTREIELKNARMEQQKIMLLRIEKMFEDK